VRFPAAPESQAQALFFGAGVGQCLFQGLELFDFDIPKYPTIHPVSGEFKRWVFGDNH
jgi:hypothetical protein